MSDEGTLGPLVPVGLYKTALRERDAAVALLRELEWAGRDAVGQDFETWQCCPMCEADKYDMKHREGCRLAAILVRGE